MLYQLQVLSWIGVSLCITYRRYFMKLKTEVKDSGNVSKETSIQSIRDLEIFIKSNGNDKEHLDICIRRVREDGKTITGWVNTKVLSWIGISSEETYRYYGIVMPNTLDMEALTKRIAKENNIDSESKVKDKAISTQMISNERTTLSEWLGKEKETLIKLMEKAKVAFTEWKENEKEMLTKWMRENRETDIEWIKEERETFAERQGKERKMLNEWMGEETETIIKWMKEVRETFVEWKSKEKEKLSEWIGKEEKTLTQWMAETIETLTDWKEKEKVMLNEWIREEKETVFKLMKGKREITEWKSKEKLTLIQRINDDIAPLTDWQSEGKGMLSKRMAEEYTSFSEWIEREKERVIKLIDNKRKELIQKENETFSEIPKGTGCFCEQVLHVLLKFIVFVLCVYLFYYLVLYKNNSC